MSKNLSVDSNLSSAKLLLEKHKIFPSDADFLMAFVLGVNKSDLFKTHILSTKDYHKFWHLINRRIKHYPMDCLIGYTDFLNIRIPFSKYVLTPRQETEILVDKVINDIGKNDVDVLDLCTGSGCIGIAIAKNTNAQVVLADISKKAIAISKTNALLNGVKVTTINSNLFDKILTQFDIIISNPPYIERSEMVSLEKEVKSFDPRIALDGGIDGLDFYKKIIENAPKFLKNKGKIYFEIGYNQGAQVKILLEKDFENIEIIKDYSGLDRYVIANKK